MAQRLAAVAVSVWDHTQADEKADPDGTPVGPITEPTTESQVSAPVAQQEPASPSFGPVAPMPTQNLQNEQMDSPMELGPQERRERKGARPSETPTSEISGRPLVKTRPASSPMIVPTAEGSGTVVLSTPASSSKDEMTFGGLYVAILAQTCWAGVFLLLVCTTKDAKARMACFGGSLSCSLARDFEGSTSTRRSNNMVCISRSIQFLSQTSYAYFPK